MLFPSPKCHLRSLHGARMASACSLFRISRIVCKQLVRLQGAMKEPVWQHLVFPSIPEAYYAFICIRSTEVVWISIGIDALLSAQAILLHLHVFHCMQFHDC